MKNKGTSNILKMDSDRYVKEDEAEILNRWLEQRFPIFITPNFKYGKTVYIKKVDGNIELSFDDLKLAEQLLLNDKLQLNCELECTLVKDAESVKILVDDILTFENENYIDKSLSERKEKLNELFDKGLSEVGFLEILELEVNDKNQLMDAVNQAASSEIVEGLYLKQSTSLYLVDKENPNWFEIKKAQVKDDMALRDQDDIDLSNVSSETDLLILSALGYNVEEIQKFKEPTDRKTILKSGEKDLVEVCKVNTLSSEDEQRFVLGVVTEPMYMDANGHIMTPAEVEKMAHKFLEHHRVIGFVHEEKLEAVVVESYITRVDMEINGQFVKKGSWVLGVVVYDDMAWEFVKMNLINGFSIGGFGREKDLT